MKKIVAICQCPAQGHINPSLVLSEYLVTLGFEVVYFSSIDYKAHIEAQGFTFECALEETDVPNWNDASKLEKLRESVSKYDISLAFVDPIISLMIVPFAEKNIRIAWLASSYMLAFSFRYGPAAFPHMPANSLFGFIRNAFDWLKIAYGRRAEKKEALHAYKKVLAPAKLKTLKLYDLNYLVEYPIFVTAPEFLDLYKQPGVYYLGLSVSKDRKEVETVNSAFNDQSSLKIYCSFGTSSHFYGEGPRKVFSEIAKVMRRNPSWEMIFNNGKIEFESAPQNITLVKKCNQIQLIQQADVVITHGGLGTIKECIANHKPMLVVPFTYDQPGNGARVERIGLGLTTRTPNTNAAEIERSLISLMDNQRYNEALGTIISKVKRDDIEVDALGMLHSLLHVKGRINDAD